MLVFRELQRTVSSASLLEGLFSDLRRLQLAPPDDKSEDLRESALLRAGELECGLFDHYQSTQPNSANLALSSGVTDSLAQAFLTPSLQRELAHQGEQLCTGLSCPPALVVSSPEGFCFYALHPRAYAEATLGLDSNESFAVIGIRTIGATLSAVVTAALHKNRKCSLGIVERTTVRPEGHPYNRQAHFASQTLAFVRNHRERNSTFLIVDEGPGFSGSSFLSVAEALTQEGIPAQQITFLTSRDTNPESLVAPEAATRWRKFHAITVSTYKCLPSPEGDLLPDVDWRNHLLNQPHNDASPYRNPQSWPAMWSSMSSPKFFSAKSQSSSACPTIFKFEGLGAYGAVVRARAHLVHHAGFGPTPTAAANGFTAYPMLQGQLLSIDDLSQGWLYRMAEYLAFRCTQMPVDPKVTNQSALESMARFNCAQITGSELGNSFHLDLRHPVVADARMMPYEWIRLHNDGGILKLDAAAHGDNHFFPGPTDIAWDLAGAIIEWRLDSASADCLLRAYEKISGDAARSRLPAYLAAYTAFQAGYAQMAAASVDDAAEKSRFLRDFRDYRKTLSRLCAATVHSSAI